MNKAAKAIRKAEKGVRVEVKDTFRQDFAFFRDTIIGWPFSKRFKFACALMLRKV